MPLRGFLSLLAVTVASSVPPVRSLSQTATATAVPCTTPSPYYATFEGTSTPEIRGTASSGELWALLPSRPPQPENTNLKIVIYITGTGALQLSATGPDGQTVSPLQPPMDHGPGNGPPSHPGDDWGTEWSFPTAGCWHVHAQRPDVSGDFWLDIAAPTLHITRFALVQDGKRRMRIKSGIPSIFVIRVVRHNSPEELPDVHLDIRERGQRDRSFSLFATTSGDTTAAFRQTVHLSVGTTTPVSASVLVSLGKVSASKSFRFQVSP